MKEIKFRAWDDVEDLMYYTGEETDIIFYFDDNGIVAEKILGDYETEKLPYLKYMPFTGLYDRKGTPIYEGDIAKSGKRLFVARWNNDIASFVWEPLDGKSSYPCFNVGTVKNVEIVGNIYENPELLEGEE